MKMKAIFNRKFALIQNSKKTDKMSWTNLILQTNLTDSFIRRIIVEFDCMGGFE